MLVVPASVCPTQQRGVAPGGAGGAIIWCGWWLYRFFSLTLQCQSYHIMFKKLLTALLPVLAAMSMQAQSDSTFSYKPQLDGVIRLRAELDTETGDSRLAVRNARLSVRGNVCAPVTYFLQADFCDQGKFIFLDAYLQGALGRGWSLRGGQFRVPFGRDVFRIPGRYIFVNRSFIARDILNMRAVGAQGAFKPAGLPLTFTAGAFSPEAIGAHKSWTNQYTLAAKAALDSGHWHAEISAASAAPDSVRFNLFDAAVTYTVGALTLEGEYALKHYTHHRFNTCHAYNVWASYDIPTRLKWFKQWSWQARMDGTTAHSTATRAADGYIKEDQPRRNRLTIGTTLVAPLPRNTRLAIHLNYEKYFYPTGYTAAETRRDAICAEVVALF